MTDLTKVIQKRKKRVGRGYGSGKGGHTVGRGQKGQKARSKIGILFEGVKVKKSLLRRLPLQRGKGKLKSAKKPMIVKLEVLNLLASGSKVSLKSLAEAGIINLKDGQKVGVKILAGGKIQKKLTITLPISKSAARQVKKIGGKII